MEIQKFKEFLTQFIYSEDFNFGFVSGSPKSSQFFVRADGNRLTYDRIKNTISVPSEVGSMTLPEMKKTNFTANNLLNRLKNNETVYYVPISEADEFQAQTAIDGYVLPYELVPMVELILGRVHEEIKRFSIDSRKYK